MRKISLVLMLTALLVLAACGESKTVSGVIEETIEKSKELESYTVEMKVDTAMMGMDMTIDGKGDVTHNPDTMYMEMKMGMTGLSVDIEMYAVENEYYMGMFGEWFIMDEEELGIESFDQLNEEELEKLKQFEEQFEMTEEDGKYVLTLSGEGEEYEKLIETYVDTAMGDIGMDPEAEAMFEDLKVNSFEMELTIDKKTMLMETQTVAADLEIDGESVPINVEATILNVNAVDPIEIPEEVKENAEAFDDFAEGFVEESMPLDEIKEKVDFPIPEVTSAPKGYELADSVYFADESVDMELVYLTYANDKGNEITLYIHPSLESYGEIYEDKTSEKVSVNDNEAIFESLDDEIFFLTWEHDNGTILELSGEGADMSKELLIEFGEGIE